jgi:protein ImuB
MAAPQRRPIWLLPRPVRLETVSVVGSAVDQADASSGPPVWFSIGGQRHEVVKAHGPERIETAWWRGPTVRRDYYVVETSTGGRYWIFRRLRGEWFLHGTFS